MNLAYRPNRQQLARIHAHDAISGFRDQRHIVLDHDNRYAKVAADIVDPEGRTVAELAEEIKLLRKELSKTQMEREILKKATAYFAKESLPGTRS